MIYGDLTKPRAVTGTLLSPWQVFGTIIKKPPAITDFGQLYDEATGALLYDELTGSPITA